MEIAKSVKTPFRGSVLNQLFGAAIETYLNFHFHHCRMNKLKITASHIYST